MKRLFICIVVLILAFCMVPAVAFAHGGHGGHAGRPRNTHSAGGEPRTAVTGSGAADLIACPFDSCAVSGPHRHGGEWVFGASACAGTGADPCASANCPAADCTAAGIHAHGDAWYCGTCPTGGVPRRDSGHSRHSMH